MDCTVKSVEQLCLQRGMSMVCDSRIVGNLGTVYP